MHTNAAVNVPGKEWFIANSGFCLRGLETRGSYGFLLAKSIFKIGSLDQFSTGTTFRYRKTEILKHALFVCKKCFGKMYISIVYILHVYFYCIYLVCTFLSHISCIYISIVYILHVYFIIPFNSFF